MTNVISVKCNIILLQVCLKPDTELEMAAVALEPLFLESFGVYDRRVEELTKE